jgi:hypothetical protein
VTKAPDQTGHALQSLSQLIHLEKAIAYSATNGQI